MKIVKFFVGCLLLSFIIVETAVLFSGFRYREVEADYVIVLGARLYGDVVSPAFANRLQVSAAYLKKHPESLVIVTGGRGEDEWIAEAEAGKKYLIREGIEEARILIENRSTSTFENIQYAKSLMDGRGLRVMIATNRFHIFRSLMIARRCGLQAYSLPAPTPPTIILSSYLREYPALLKSFVLDRP
ncbi:MAG: YdcF family protein [Filifactor alocis]|nr:YdcF family protein [Filifactor alocis]